MKKTTFFRPNPYLTIYNHQTPEIQQFPVAYGDLDKTLNIVCQPTADLDLIVLPQEKIQRLQMTLTSITALLTPYQAFQVQKWHRQNVDEYLVPKITDINIRNTCFKKFPDWTAPTPDEVKQLFSATGMTQKQASEYLGLKDNNGRAFRRYINGESTITYAYWVLLCAYVGVEKFW